MNSAISPEEWEAHDHIVNLKQGIPPPGEQIKGICPYHPALAGAMIWLIRRIEIHTNGKDAPKQNGQGAAATAIIGLAKASPLTALALSIGFGAWVFAKWQGIL